MTDALLDMLLRSTAVVNHSLSLLATLGTVLGGLFAAYASWHLTDRLIAWRQRAD